MSGTEHAVSEDHQEVIDLEVFAKEGRQPPTGMRYRIRIDREYFVVDAPCMTGRELLQLAGKSPPDQWMISQKLRGGQVAEIGLNQKADFTTPGVERFMTLPLDQTEG